MEAAPLVWIDLEMSGLDPETCEILEIAILITDDRLGILAEGPDLVIHHPERVLQAMDEWCTTQHGRSGLTDLVRSSSLSLAEAEAQILAFVRRYTEPGKSPLCGNSIWQDRRFLIKFMPELDRHLHYRMIDVSTVKELVRRWYPDVVPPTKTEQHRALGDIYESLAELRFYRAHAFRQTPSAGG